ncbi:MAG: hypothetical protein K2K70_11510 [Lachnospiraceae bacterium]|nr:hypothetical protein [Lachnospiraceae bacterium]
MYHYILQIHQEPRREEDWVAEEDFINRPDLIPIADHVKTVYDRDSAIRHFGQWFTGHHMGTFSGDSFTLAPDARSHYFEGRFPEFKKNLKALDTVTEPLYIHDQEYVENLLSDLASSFCSCRSCYVMESDDPPVPFDKFIRTAVPGMHYYIGAVLEYHC